MCCKGICRAEQPRDFSADLLQGAGQAGSLGSAWQMVLGSSGNHLPDIRLEK